MKIALGLLMAVSMLAAQNANDTPEAHVAIAKTAAGDDYQNLFNFLCAVPVRGAAAQEEAVGSGRGRRRDRLQINVVCRAGEGVRQPVLLGQTEYSVWAVTTSEGIIVIDTIFDYSVEEEVDGGLKKLGLDPATIKYAVVTHPHPDHHGGAKFLQDQYGTRVIMSAADWDFLDRTNGTKPKRDMVATDGQKLTLGDTTLTLYITPGHTPGTISALIPVKDNGTAAPRGSLGRDGAQCRPGFPSDLHPVGEAVQRHRAAGRCRHHPFEPHRLGPIEGQPAAAGEARPRQRESICGGQSNARRYLKVAEECATSRVMRLN